MKQSIVKKMGYALVLGWFAACSGASLDEPDLPANRSITITPTKPGYEIDFSDVSQTKTVTFTGLTGKSLYLVKYARVSAPASATGAAFTQTSDQAATRSASALVPATVLADTRSQASGTDSRPVSGVFTAPDGTLVTRYEHQESPAWRDTEPALVQAARSRVSRSLRNGVAYTPSTLRDTKHFWVEAGGALTDSDGDGWVLIPATLQAQSTHANVWIASDNLGTSGANNDNRITAAQAQALATAFDTIYQRETPIFGYEYGGGPGGNGGRDGDLRIQILIYDIDGDYATTQGTHGGVFGFFTSRDWFTPAELARQGVTLKTNEAEIFYIDADLSDFTLDGAKSTLIHEFQHMINWNVKTIRSFEARRPILYSATWWNEMLSMLAEDLIDPFIGIPVTHADHPAQNRIPLFLATYPGTGVTQWTGIVSYANAYAFGAYLVRNFGGAAVVQEMMANQEVDEAAIAAAVNAVGGQGTGWTFPALMARYGEALVYTGAPAPAGVFSFNKTVTVPLSGVNYTFAAFDSGGMANSARGRSYLSPSLAAQIGPDAARYVYPARGPVVIDTAFMTSMAPQSILIQSCDAWRAPTGSLTVVFNKPAAGIQFFVLFK